VRKGTKSFISILSLGVVAAGYQAGQAAEISSGFSASAPISVGTTAGSTAPIASGTTSAGSETLNTPAAVSSPTTTAAVVPAKTTTSSSSAPKASAAAPAAASTPKATTAAPAPAPAATTAAPAPAATSSTKTGSAISYRYGTVQVSVTKANGKITAVNLLQQGATGGRQGAFPYLVQYAIQANGSSFGNLGGATYTTDAFKQSLESALAKF
jgi:uncharacterized protein with FMN-binding domain